MGMGSPSQRGVEANGFRMTIRKSGLDGCNPHPVTCPKHDTKLLVPLLSFTMETSHAFLLYEYGAALKSRFERGIESRDKLEIVTVMNLARETAKLFRNDGFTIQEAKDLMAFLKFFGLKVPKRIKAIANKRNSQPREYPLGNGDWTPHPELENLYLDCQDKTPVG